MITFRTSLVLVGLLAVGLSAAPIAGSKDEPIAVQDNSKATPVPVKEDKPKESAPKKHRGRFTIGKETTYITGPLDKDGYIDYAAALNERLGKGVTAENNANVLIWKAIGPRPEGKEMPAEFFKLMGMEPPPEKGDYFIDLDKHLNDQFKIKPETKEAYEIRDQLNRCVQRPW